jgi:hypothetical protein
MYFKNTNTAMMLILEVMPGTYQVMGICKSVNYSQYRVINVYGY